MVDARVIALVLGIVGAAFGVAAVVLDVPALGAAAGLAALAAGAVAVWGTGRAGPTPSGADDVARDETIDRTRRELADARAEADSLRAELAGRQDSAPDPVRSIAADDVVSGTDPSALTDADSQLFSEAYFRVALQSRLASARRHLRPVSVCLMEVSEGQADNAAIPAPAGRVADAIRETLREADIACRMDDGSFAVILEDTPENGAVWTVERTRRNLVSRSGTHTMWAGVACYPAHAFSGDELLDQARSALEAAQEWNQDRIEVAAVEG